MTGQETYDLFIQVTF